jgi:hypothetical protein
MSLESIAYVYQHAKSLPPDQLLVLLTIAYHAEAIGHSLHCWPSEIQSFLPFSSEIFDELIRELWRCGQLSIEKIGDLNDVTYRILSGRQQGLASENLLACLRSVLSRSGRYRLEDEEYTLQMLQSMPYPAFLQTKYWQVIRQYMLQKYGGCQLCLGEEELHVHHRSYRFRGCEIFHLEDLIVLCANCHAKFHDKLPARDS